MVYATAILDFLWFWSKVVVCWCWEHTLKRGQLNICFKIILFKRERANWVSNWPGSTKKRIRAGPTKTQKVLTNQYRKWAMGTKFTKTLRVQKQVKMMSEPTSDTNDRGNHDRHHDEGRGYWVGRQERDGKRAPINSGPEHAFHHWRNQTRKQTKTPYLWQMQRTEPRGTCMVPSGVLCDISLILDSEKNQAQHHNQHGIVNMRMHL